MSCVITNLIFIFFLLYALISLAFSVRDDYFTLLNQDLGLFNSEEEVSELFQVWKKKCDRQYESLEEETTRFETFKSNLKYIKERNAQKKSSSNDYILGLNEFSDMSFEEFSEIYLPETTGSIIKSNMVGTMVSSNNESCPNAPSSLDWRLSGAVTNVKNQGTCGSCWAFSATGAIEGINQIVSQWLPNLSEQQLISCDKNNSGCGGGVHFEAFQYVLENGGIATERDYPYDANDGACNSTLENKKFATIDGYNYWWNTPISENTLFCAVSKQPVSVSFYANRDFGSYKSGIFDGADFSSINSSCGHNHAMLIVGYGSLGADQNYWVVKNSWGTSWGQCGYVLIKRNTGQTQGVNNINCAGAYPTKQINTAFNG